MREWLLIMCVSAYCAEPPIALQVSEGQCRAVLDLAEGIAEMNGPSVKTGQKELTDSLRAICISPDGKMRLDSLPPSSK